MSIHFHYDIKNFRVKDSTKIKEIGERIISDSHKRINSIDFIFTSDKRILEINNEFLKHNYYTDIITFDYSKEELISGEIYISIPTVKENAEIFGKTMRSEVRRVIFHGILHLCGYNDHTNSEKELMRKMEDQYLAL
jgi:probable rRNA maturation factor